MQYSTWGSRLFHRETFKTIIFSQSSHPSENICWELGKCLSFRYFRNVATAREHLLSGLINDVLQLWFSMLQSDVSQRRVVREICGYISTSNLPRIDAVLRWTWGGECIRNYSIRQLNKLTMYDILCVLLFAIYIFKLRSFTAAANKEVQPFRLPKLLQNVV